MRFNVNNTVGAVFSGGFGQQVHAVIQRDSVSERRGFAGIVGTSGKYRERVKQISTIDLRIDMGDRLNFRRSRSSHSVKCLGGADR